MIFLIHFFLVHTCVTPLGVEDKRISDTEMTASTQHDAKFAPKFGRLNIKKTATNYGGWCSRTANKNEWLQVRDKTLIA